MSSVADTFSALSVSSNNCTAAKIFAKSNLLFFLNTTHCLFSLVAIILYCIIVRRITDKSKKTFHLHANLKIIFSLGSTFYIIFSFFTFCQHFYHMILYLFTFVDACAYQIAAWQCAVLRIPNTYCLIGFTLFHLVVFLERSCAILYVKTYEKMSVKAGIVACSVWLLITCAYCFYLFYSEDYGISKSYCSISSSTNAAKLEGLNNILLSADTLITIADCFLRSIIHKQNKRKIDNYSLQTAYQIKENVLSIKLIFPLALVHSSLFISHLLSLYIGKRVLVLSDALDFMIFLETVTLITDLYVVTTVSTFYFLILQAENRIKSEIIPKIKSADAHFKLFNQQIQ